MYSFKKWLYKPRKSDKSLLAQFYFADEELNNVATELDSFDSRKDPERCQALVSQLRTCQDRVLTTVQRMMAEAIPDSRTNRDFRVKFPDDVVQENLSGQLWFGAECLAAGSSIMNREVESACMRPLARALTKNLDSLRHILREQCLISVNEYSERIKEALIIFDKLFAEFELRYVSAMVPVKTVKEYETIQEITVLFSETAIRAKSLGYITTDMIDEYDPALMFTIPRLAIVCGLLIFPDGPLNPDNPSWTMSDMFRPFQTLLFKIRELLFTLSDAELFTLERALCSQEEPEYLDAVTTTVAISTATATTSSNSETALIYGPTTTPASTSTIAIQTESFIIGRNTTEDVVSWCSDDSAEFMLTEEQQHPQQMLTQRDCPFEEIACHTGGLHNVEGGGQACHEAGVVACEECETWRDESCNVSGPSDSKRCPGSSGTNGRHLNKSDSKDSGLHSEVVSSSDSQHTLSSCHSTQLLATSSPVPSSAAEQMPELYLEDDDDGDMADVSLETMAGSTRSDLRHEMPRKMYRARSDAANAGRSEESSPAEDVEEGYEEMFGSSGCLYRRCYTDGEGEDGEEEEEQFYTPLTGFSPLHQPSLCSAKPDEGASEFMSNGSLNYSVGTENCDAYPASPTIEVSDSCSYVGNASPLCLGDGSDSGADSRTFTCQFSGVLQKVQAMFTSSPSVSVEVEGSWDSEMSDSPLTDTTLTDIAPLDSSAGENPASNCDSCAMDISCDREQENQNDFVLPQVQGDGEGWALADGADVSQSGHSTSHCDRCTQTPHSAINNEMSSKIHHHHHHRKHSSPARCHACSTTAFVGTACNADSTSPLPGNDKDKKDLPSTQHRGPQTASVAPTHARSPPKRQTGDKRCSRRGASKRISSSRTEQQKVGKAGQMVAPAVQEAASRLQHSSKGWAPVGTARRSTGASSSSSGCEGSTSTSDCDSDQDSCGSTETSSYNSESHDDEEIALAVQAAEMVNRNQARARFRSSSDMIHRLFVCISGVADQLQTNFAGDLRNILRVVFNLNCSEPIVMEEEKTFRRHRRGNRFFHHALGGDNPQQRAIRDPPTWVPDDQSLVCMSCKTPFTFVRRRHHCRNCGKIFCGRCSSNAVSLPHFGHSKPVRVCNHCFVFQVNPFAVS